MVRAVLHLALRQFIMDTSMAFVQIVFAHGSVHKLSRLVLLVVFSKLRRVGGVNGLHQDRLTWYVV